jgi:hypothetical protein
MNMQGHILAALREQFDRWEELLRGMSEEQVTTPLAPSEWSIKDEMAHLRAWQQRSIIRLEAAQHNREPAFPEWIPGVEAESEENTDRLNAWIFQSQREVDWETIHTNWRKGFLRFLELGEGILERDLLDPGRYLWMKGHPLAFVLVASYDHHQEHLDTLSAWLGEHDI